MTELNITVIRQRSMRCPLAEQIKAYEAEYIRNLARQGGCVIVGRCADFILADRKECLNVFVYGTPEDRAARVAARNAITQTDALEHIMERDEKRASYVQHMTG